MGRLFEAFSHLPGEVARKRANGSAPEEYMFTWLGGFFGRYGIGDKKKRTKDGEIHSFSHLHVWSSM